MSASGQKQTCAVHKPSSALPPIATAKADIDRRLVRCIKVRSCYDTKIRRAAGAHCATFAPSHESRRLRAVKNKPANHHGDLNLTR